MLLAALILFSGKGEPLALVGDGFAVPAQIIGTLVSIAVVWGLYRWTGCSAGR